MNLRFVFTFSLNFVVLAVLCVNAAAAEELAIHTARGSITFDVELADDPEERARGLMFRTSLAPNAGMLFDFQHEQTVRMWMKNTLIPLDMIFVDADGRIVRIEPETTPYSTKIVGSGGPVRAVLELNGGVAAQRGIRPGDRVVHRIFEAQE